MPPAATRPLRSARAHKVTALGLGGSIGLRVLIVDDEKLAREELQFLLGDLEDIEVAGFADNGPEAIDQIKALEPDVVFLDVQMPGLDGIGVARRLLEEGVSLPYLVFATAYDQYALEAFEVAAADYLLKPIDRDRLARTIERARKLLTKPVDSGAQVAKLLEKLQPTADRRKKLLVKYETRMFLVDASDIVFASIDEGVITVATTHFEGESNCRTLEELETTLESDAFWRVHRSYLVNLNRIQEVLPDAKSQYQLRMADRNHTEVPVSRAQTKRLRELFNL